jgi:hypothetical protein
MPRASQSHRSRMHSSMPRAHATPFHHHFTAHACDPACRVLAAHMCGPTCCVLVPRASHLQRSRVCPCGTPCAHATCFYHPFNAHASDPACRVLVPRAPYLQRSGGALTCCVHMPCVSYPHRSRMRSTTPCAVATCFHRLFSAHVGDPACRVLIPRASCPPRSCV